MLSCSFCSNIPDSTFPFITEAFVRFSSRNILKHSRFNCITKHYQFSVDWYWGTLGFNHNVISCRMFLSWTGSARPLDSFWTAPMSLFSTFLLPPLITWTWRAETPQVLVKEIQHHRRWCLWLSLVSIVERMKYFSSFAAFNLRQVCEGGLISSHL